MVRGEPPRAAHPEPPLSASLRVRSTRHPPGPRGPAQPPRAARGHRSSTSKQPALGYPGRVAGTRSLCWSTGLHARDDEWTICGRASKRPAWEHSPAMPTARTGFGCCRASQIASRRAVTWAGRSASRIMRTGGRDHVRTDRHARRRRRRPGARRRRSSARRAPLDPQGAMTSEQRPDRQST